MDTCIFCKIAKKEIPKEFIYEDTDVMVFPDLHPIKPIHVLIVPKVHVDDFYQLTTPLDSKLRIVVQKMILHYALMDKGYRIVINGGGAQVINHLHLHLIGPLGKHVTW